MMTQLEMGQLLLDQLAEEQRKTRDLEDQVSRLTIVEILADFRRYE